MMQTSGDNVYAVALCTTNYRSVWAPADRRCIAVTQRHLGGKWFINAGHMVLLHVSLPLTAVCASTAVDYGKVRISENGSKDNRR